MRIKFQLIPKCNMKCWYCNQNKIKKVNISEDEVYNNFEEILTFFETKTNNIDELMFLGGEVSIFNDNFLNKILNRTKKYKRIFFTNGLVKNELIEDNEQNYFIEHVIDWEHRFIFKEKDRCYMYLPEPGKLSEMEEFYKLNKILPSFMYIDDKILKYSKEEYNFLKLGLYNHCPKKGLDVNCMFRSIGKCCNSNKRICFEEFYKLNDKEFENFIAPINEQDDKTCLACRQFAISDLDPEIQEDILKNDYWPN